MKNLSTSILLLLLLLPVSIGAQVREKKLFIETSTAYADGRHQHGFIIAPAVGYQLNEHLSAGLKVNFETGRLPYIIYTPFIRYNYLTAGKLQLFTEGQLNIATREADGGQSSYTEAGLGMGGSYSLGKHIGLVAHYLFAGWSSNKQKEGAWLRSGEWGLDANAKRFQIGVQILF